MWALEGTFLNVTLNNQTRTKHYLLMAVDPSMNKYVFTKVFYSGAQKKIFSSTPLVKALETALKNEEINDTSLK